MNVQGTRTQVQQLLEKVEATRASIDICPVSKLHDLTNDVAGKARVLYWIFTKHSLGDLQAFASPAIMKRVDIRGMAQNYAGLSNVKQREPDGWLLVYSGRGKYQRVRGDHFGSPWSGIGCLALPEHKNYEPDKWGVQVVVDSGSHKFGLAFNYAANAGVLERAWRLHYGWPILCKQ